MEITKRIYVETLQVREYAVKADGIGREWIPRIEKIYKFCSIDEFLRTFKPTKLSRDLRSAIEKAYNECGRVTFNVGNGNRTFYFTKEYVIGAERKINTLRMSNIESLIGKRIQWVGDSYEHNPKPTGVAIITEIDMGNRKPIISTTISGQNLNHAFIDYHATDKEDKPFSYGDEMRYIEYIVLKNETE